MTEEEDLRLSELLFFEFCARHMLSKTSMSGVKVALSLYRTYFDFDLEAVYQAALDIFDTKYIASREELVFLLHKAGYTQTAIAKLLNKTQPLVCNILQGERPFIMKRGTKEQALLVKDFMNKYHKFIRPNFSSMILGG